MHTFAQKPKATQQTTSTKPTIPSRGHLGPSFEARSILHLQPTIGNQAVQRMLQTDAGQPEAELTGPASPRSGHEFSRILVQAKAPVETQSKLAVNAPNDICEQEADRVSEQVMRMPEPQLQHACPCGGECPKCRREQPGREHESLQTKHVPASDTGQTAAPPIVHEVLRSPGQPLDPATRAFMEPRFGHDFSRVRVHTGAAAAESALDVNAHAYTVGADIVFAEGRYAPATQEARRLLAHELTHVLQQSGAAGNMLVQRTVAEPSLDELQREAAQIASELAHAEQVGADLVEQNLGNRPNRPGNIQSGLRGLEKRGGTVAEDAKDLRKEIEGLTRRVEERRAQIRRARARRLVPPIDKTKYAAEAEESAAKAKQSAAKTTVKSETAAAQTLVEAEESAANLTTKSAGAVVTNVENAVAGTAPSRLSRFRSGLVKGVGTVLGALNIIDPLLLPGPLDAIGLMIKFAGAYAEAQEAIRNNNTRTGFAIGFSAFLLGRSYGAVGEHLSRKSVVDRSVTTQVVDAVGIAEKSHNVGLKAGFHYGELLSDDMKDALREFGFSALALQGRLPKRQELFTAEGVTRLAGALLPKVDQIFEAMRVEAEKQAKKKEMAERRERDEKRGTLSGGMKF